MLRDAMLICNLHHFHDVSVACRCNLATVVESCPCTRGVLYEMLRARQRSLSVFFPFGMPSAVHVSMHTRMLPLHGNVVIAILTICPPLYTR